MRLEPFATVNIKPPGPGGHGQVVDVLRTVWTTQKAALPTLAHNLPTPARNKHRRQPKMPFGPDALRLPYQVFKKSDWHSRRFAAQNQKQFVSQSALNHSTRTLLVRPLPTAQFRLIPVLELTILLRCCFMSVECSRAKTT